MLLNYFNTKFFFFILSLTIFLIHQFIFQRLLIFDNHLAGEDFYYFVPNLVFGKLWFIKNGIIPPDFAAHKCGIIPFFADPNSVYYSLIQVLFIFFSPSSSIKIFFFILSFLSFIGTFLLFKRSFKFSKYISLICSSIFLFAGNNVYPMLAGHVNLVLFMLVPINCYLIIESLQNKNSNLKYICLILSSIIFSSYIYGGAAAIFPFIVVTSFIIILIFSIESKNNLIFKNYFLSLFIGLIISASKISYTLHLLENFPRKLDSTILTNFLNFLYTFVTSFFLVPDPFFYERQQFNIKKTYMHLHGLEFGLSVIPLLMFFLLIFNYKKIKKIEFNFNKILLIILLIFPIFYIFKFGFITEILEKMPIVSSIWERNRFFYIYTIPIIILCAYSFKITEFLNNKKITILLIVLIPIVQTFTYHLARDYFFPEKSFKNKAIYSMKSVSEFSKNIKKENINSYGIKNIDYFIDQNRLDKNEGFLTSTCKLFCYSTAYGYHAEKLPINFISRAKDYQDKIKVLEDGLYNVFNPSCLLFPEENSCKIGDRIKKNENELINNLLNYEPIKFKKPIIQEISNFLSKYSIIFLLFLLFFYLLNYIRSLFYRFS